MLKRWSLLFLFQVISLPVFSQFQLGLPLYDDSDSFHFYCKYGDIKVNDNAVLLGDKGIFEEVKITRKSRYDSLLLHKKNFPRRLQIKPIGTLITTKSKENFRLLLNYGKNTLDKALFRKLEKADLHLTNSDTKPTDIIDFYGFVYTLSFTKNPETIIVYDINTLTKKGKSSRTILLMTGNTIRTRLNLF
ncbi:hypothetical protein FUAX_55130 (plasmid) [Fulvitalea axinellae]|uniref:Uncharacterized protein n=1 Tax=Fulvitalea axinellae TaxID=1182444 RepID=A0AAU9CVJ8_9BACT|nr:hypothetical protein FUAX_55130 [Fulvitalea axinellae]